MIVFKLPRHYKQYVFRTLLFGYLIYNKDVLQWIFLLKELVT